MSNIVLKADGTPDLRYKAGRNHAEYLRLKRDYSPRVVTHNHISGEQVAPTVRNYGEPVEQISNDITGQRGTLSKSISSDFKSADKSLGGTPEQREKLELFRTALEMEGIPVARKQQVGRAMAELINEIGKVPEPSGQGSMMTMAMMGAVYGEEGEAMAEPLANIDGTTSEDHQMGMVTGADLQEMRFKSMDLPIQAAMVANLTGQIDLGISGMAAREEMAEVTGESPEQFAARFNIPEGVNLPISGSENARTALSMQRRAGEYMDLGPGGRLLSQNVTGESEEVLRDKLQGAYSKVEDFADLYFTDAAKAGPLYSQRKKTLTGELISHLLDGSQSWKPENALPLPNQLSTEGLVATKAVGWRAAAGDTSPYTPMQHAEAMNKLRNQEVVSYREQEDLINAGPSLERTLEKQALEGMQDFEGLVRDISGVRDILREDGLSTRDEYRGNRTRVLGRDNVDYDQAAQYEFRNMALNSDIDNYRDISMPDDESPVDIFVKARMGEYNDLLGSGFSSEESMTMLSTIGGRTEKVVAPSGSDLEAYRDKVANSSSPAQGSKEWLAQREGVVTGSKAKELWKGMGDSRLAATLASEKLGITEDISNAYTSRGNKMEDKVKASFLAKEGKGLIWEEAFFETDPSQPGFGASPDGRLFNEDGSSAGLLELKYFSDKTFNSAYEMTMPQMQMQMMVSGETQTHFFATNADTGEAQHRIAKADPVMQAELKKLGLSALSMAEGLDVRGVDKLRTKTKGARRQKNAQVQDTTPAKAFRELKEEVEELMTPFVPKMDDENESIANVFGAAGDTELAKLMIADEQREQKKKVRDAMAEDVESISVIKPLTSAQSKKATTKAAKAFVDGNQRTSSLEIIDFAEGGKSSMAKFYEAEEAKAQAMGNTEASRVTAMGKAEEQAYAFDEKRDRSAGLEEVAALAENAKRASDSMKEFSSATKNAVNILGELGGVVMQGNKSGMDESRLAAKVGLDVENVRGMREAMEKGGMSPQGIDATINRAGSLVNTFNDKREGAAEWTRMMSARGASDLPEVNNLAFPEVTEMGKLDAQGITALVATQLEGKSKEARAQITNIWKMKDATFLRASGETISRARDSAINEEGLFDTLQGILTYSQAEREVKEAAGSAGEGFGLGAATAIGVAGVAGTATAMTATKMLGQTARGAQMAKTLSTAAKVSTPIALALGIAPAAIRAVGDIKDDGGAGDSAMDVLDFATYGAGIGATVGMIGGPLGVGAATALGGVIGGAVGLVNEGYEYMTNDAIPSESIGNMPTPQKANAGASKQVNNVDVKVEISPDLVKTTTNINGDLDVDEEAGLNTGS